MVRSGQLLGARDHVRLLRSARHRPVGAEGGEHGHHRPAALPNGLGRLHNLSRPPSHVTRHALPTELPELGTGRRHLLLLLSSLRQVLLRRLPRQDR